MRNKRDNRRMCTHICSVRIWVQQVIPYSTGNIFIGHTLILTAGLSSSALVNRGGQNLGMHDGGDCHDRKN